jgi:hypothetical protein
MKSIMFLLLAIFVAGCSSTKSSYKLNSVVLNENHDVCDLYPGTLTGDRENISGDLLAVKIFTNNEKFVVGAIAPKDIFLTRDLNRKVYVRQAHLMEAELQDGSSATYNFTRWVVDDATAQQMIKRKQCILHDPK